jgi:hypothetical protein
MSTITVPVVNQHPDTITVTFPSEYAVSMEVANPYLLVDGLTGANLAAAVASCQPGGAGVIGGPEYVNFLQRSGTNYTASYGTATAFDKSGVSGFGCEQFELSAYPGYTFYSFKNFLTGQKNVVAFSQSAANMPAQTIATIAAKTALAGATASIPSLAASGATGVASYAWSGSAIGTGLTGQGTNNITFYVTGATGPRTLSVVVTEGGSSVTSSATITVS